MAMPASLDDDLEHRVQATGRRLIAAFEQRRQAAPAVAEALRKRGIGSSLDLVGEAVVSDAEAEEYQRRYLDFFARIPPKAAAWPPHPVLDEGQGRRLPRLNVSIKLSSLDPQLAAVAPEAGAARIRAGGTRSAGMTFACRAGI